MGRRQPAASARCSHDRGSPETLEHRTELVELGLEGFTFSTSGHDGGLRPSSTTLSEGKARGLTVDLRLRTRRVPDYDAILHAGEVKHSVVVCWAGEGAAPAGVGVRDGPCVQPAHVRASGVVDGPAELGGVPCSRVRAFRRGHGPPGAGQLEDRVIKPDLYDPKINRTYADGRALRVGSTLPEPRSPRTSPALSGRYALRA